MLWWKVFLCIVDLLSREKISSTCTNAPKAIFSIWNIIPWKEANAKAINTIEYPKTFIAVSPGLIWINLKQSSVFSQITSLRVLWISQVSLRLFVFAPIISTVSPIGWNKDFIQLFTINDIVLCKKLCCEKITSLWCILLQACKYFL